MGVCGLALMDLPDLLPIDPALNITLRAKGHLDALHRQWAEQKRRKIHVENIARVRTRSIGATLDRSHAKSVVLAFGIGLIAVVVPWIYKAYLAETWVMRNLQPSAGCEIFLLRRSSPMLSLQAVCNLSLCQAGGLRDFLGPVFFWFTEISVVLWLFVEKQKILRLCVLCSTPNKSKFRN